MNKPIPNRRVQCTTRCPTDSKGPTRAVAAMMGISALRRDDSATLDELLAKMSPDSRYLRFHAVVPVLTDTLRRALLDVDEHDHVALVARADDAVIGIARLIRDHHLPHEAEIAVAVADSWHRRGVGRELVRALIGRAGPLGIERVRAWVLPGNTAALGLFRASFPACVTVRGPDVIELVGVLGASGEWQITMDRVVDEPCFPTTPGRTCSHINHLEVLT